MCWGPSVLTVYSAVGGVGARPRPAGPELGRLPAMMKCRGSLGPRPEQPCWAPRAAGPVGREKSLPAFALCAAVERGVGSCCLRPWESLPDGQRRSRGAMNLGQVRNQVPGTWRGSWPGCATGRGSRAPTSPREGTLPAGRSAAAGPQPSTGPGPERASEGMTGGWGGRG